MPTKTTMNILTTKLPVKLDVIITFKSHKITKFQTNYLKLTENEVSFLDMDKFIYTYQITDCESIEIC
jgi:hypothetical protein